MVLRETNTHLKNHGLELEDEVKLIATKLKRQIAQLKKDKLVQRGGGTANIDAQLDAMIEENFNLQEEERALLTAVKKLQSKKQQQLSGASAKVKKLTKTLGDKAASRSISP